MDHYPMNISQLMKLLLQENLKLIARPSSHEQNIWHRSLLSCNLMHRAVHDLYHRPWQRWRSCPRLPRADLRNHPRLSKQPAEPSPFFGRKSFHLHRPLPQRQHRSRSRPSLRPCRVPERRHLLRLLAPAELRRSSALPRPE